MGWPELLVLVVLLGPGALGIFGIVRAVRSPGGSVERLLKCVGILIALFLVSGIAATIVVAFGASEDVSPGVAVLTAMVLIGIGASQIGMSPAWGLGALIPIVGWYPIIKVCWH